MNELNEAELKILFDALTVYIRSGEFMPEQATEIEALWHKLRWGISVPYALTIPQTKWASVTVDENGIVVCKTCGSGLGVDES